MSTLTQPLIHEPHTIAYKELTSRIVTIGTHMQILMARSAELEAKGTMTVKDKKEYINLSTPLNEYDSLFAIVDF